MIIENAKINDLQEGDVVDLHGLEFKQFDFTSGDLCVKLGVDLVELINRDVFKSITIHRKTPQEKALEDAQKALEALNALGGNYQLVEVSKATETQIEPKVNWSEWVDWEGNSENPHLKPEIGGWVEVILRDGSISSDDAHCIYWGKHKNPDIDVVKYRVYIGKFKAETPLTPERLEGFGEWTDWHGGECPVDGDLMVEVELRSGQIETRKAKKLGWKHSEFFPSCDIIKYRII